MCIIPKSRQEPALIQEVLVRMSRLTIETGFARHDFLLTERTDDCSYYKLAEGT